MSKKIVVDGVATKTDFDNWFEYDRSQRDGFYQLGNGKVRVYYSCFRTGNRFHQDLKQ